MSSTSTFLQSVALLPAPDVLNFTNVSEPTAALPVIDPYAPLSGTDPALPEIVNYALRDKQLAYRDSINETAIAAITAKIKTVWNSNLGSPRPTFVSYDSLFTNNEADSSGRNTVVASGTDGSAIGASFSSASAAFDSSYVKTT